MIRTAGAVGKVENAGGVLFNSYKEAEDFCEHAMYPPGSEPLNAPFMASLIPNAQGHFSPHTIDNLRIYIPVRETRVVG